MTQFNADDSLDEAYTKSKVLARSVKSYAVKRSAELTAGNVSANVLIEIFNKMTSYSKEFADLVAVRGLSAYAKTQDADEAYDVGAAVRGMRKAIDTVAQTVAQKMDKHNGWVLREKFTPTGVSVRTYDPTSTAPVVAELNALANTIKSRGE